MIETTFNDLYAMLLIVLVLVISVCLWWFSRRLHTHKKHGLRPIPAFTMMKSLLGHMTEGGKIVHLALGTAGISEASVPATVSGLAVLRYLANQGASFGVSPVTTVADPTSMLVAQDTLYRAHQTRGLADNYASTDVQMIAPDPTAFAIGAQDIVNQENVAANVMIGHFDQEFLLLGEAGAQRGLIQAAGSDSVGAQPFMLATSKHVLLGEEMFAAGAYLTQEPGQVASLVVQDLLRVGVVVVILLGVIAKTLLG